MVGARQVVGAVGARQVVVAVGFFEVDKYDCIRYNPEKNYDHLSEST